ncbi:hypothetical protein A2U01_0090038, partial [Trifolium medium]|nr:hypothetical protein [Trifolium medium]
MNSHSDDSRLSYGGLDDGDGGLRVLTRRRMEEK